jgi:hypothetical protein
MKFALALFLSVSSFGVSAASVEHLEGAGFLQDAGASTPLARGLEIPAEAHVILEKGSQTLIRISPGTSLEIHGPARATLSSGLFWNLEFGKFLVFTKDLSPHRFRILGEMLRPDETSFEIEIPLSRAFAQFLVAWGSLRLAGETLEPGLVYVIEKGRIQNGQISNEDALKRRQKYEFSESLFRRMDEEETALSLRNQIVFTQVSALNAFTREGSTDNSINSTAFGLRAEWIHKRYLSFPKRPQRIHFLRAPALRLGGGATYLSSAASDVQGASQILSAHAITGGSWRGLSIDALLAYYRPSTSGVSSVSPLQYGVRGLYEWDLKQYTANDMMFGLGYSYTVSKVESYAVFRTVTQALNLAFVFNF